MNERLEEPRTEESLPDLLPEAVTEEASAAEEPTPAPAASGPSWLRLAYSIVYLIAVIAIFTLWSEVGGQGHLDLMPWYTKLACVLVSAWCVVRFTAGIVEQPRFWNRRMARWLAAIIGAAVVLAGITYYYHLHEATDEPDSEDATPTSLTTHV